MLDKSEQGISTLVISVIGAGVLLCVGLLILTSLAATQTTTDCSEGFTANGTNPNACYNYTVINDSLLGEVVPQVNTSVARTLAEGLFNQVTCSISSATNSTFGAIPSSNYTSPTNCQIRMVAGTTDGIHTTLNQTVVKVNNTVAKQLVVVNLSDVSCSLIAAYNATGTQNSTSLIPATNYTFTGCTIQATSGVNAGFNNVDWNLNYTYYYSPLDNQNWTVNYTAVWTNITGASALRQHLSSAANATNSVQEQLGTIPNWIGIIITVSLAFIVLGYFYNRFI